MNKILFVIILICGSIFAQTVDDVILLKQKGVSEEVLLAFVESADGFEITSQDIVRLKSAGVSDKIVIVILKRGKLVNREPTRVVVVPEYRTSLVISYPFSFGSSCYSQCGSRSYGFGSSYYPQSRYQQRPCIQPRPTYHTQPRPTYYTQPRPTIQPRPIYNGYTSNLGLGQPTRPTHRR